MNRWLPAVTLLLACATWPTAAPVRAGTGIQRCQAADGATIYTDKPCRMLRARPVPLPGELQMRIARDHARSRLLSIAASPGAGAVDAPVYADASAPLALAPATSGRRSVAAGCARTPTQLQMDLRGALALGDVNRIAESYHWVGVPSRAATRILDRLDALARKPVADIRYFDAWIGSGDAVFASAGDSAVGGNGGILQVAFAGQGGGSIADFDVERYKGCYFVRF